MTYYFTQYCLGVLHSYIILNIHQIIHLKSQEPCPNHLDLFLYFGKVKKTKSDLVENHFGNNGGWLFTSGLGIKR